MKTQDGGCAEEAPQGSQRLLFFNVRAGLWLLEDVQVSSGLNRKKKKKKTKKALSISPSLPVRLRRLSSPRCTDRRTCATTRWESVQRSVECNGTISSSWLRKGTRGCDVSFPSLNLCFSCFYDPSSARAHAATTLPTEGISKLKTKVWGKIPT